MKDKTRKSIDNIRTSTNTVKEGETKVTEQQIAEKWSKNRNQTEKWKKKTICAVRRRNFCRLVWVFHKFGRSATPSLSLMDDDEFHCVCLRVRVWVNHIALKLGQLARSTPPTDVHNFSNRFASPWSNFSVFAVINSINFISLMHYVQ